jgi:hypothetical protein
VKGIPFAFSGPIAILAMCSAFNGGISSPDLLHFLTENQFLGE